MDHFNIHDVMLEPKILDAFISENLSNKIELNEILTENNWRYDKLKFKNRKSVMADKIKDSIIHESRNSSIRSNTNKLSQSRSI